MKYWVTSDYSYYYEAEEQENETDIEVTQRPHVICEWDGAAWNYNNYGAARYYQYGRVSADMNKNISDIRALYNTNIYQVIANMAIASEALRYQHDNTLDETDLPMLAVYNTERSMGGLAAAATEVLLADGRGGLLAGLAKCCAQIDTLHAQIIASTDGEEILTFNWVNI